MDTSVVDASRKRKRNEEEVAELEETTFIVLSVVTMLLGVMAWYHDKYFVKEPSRNWELERRNFLNRLYRGKESDCINQLRVSKAAFFKLCRILQEKGQLVRTRNVSTTEAVAMFLHILAHNLKYRVADVLRDQRSLGRQSDGAWKAVAYNTAAQVLSTRFNVQLMGENVKNRIKLWRGWYGIVSDILSQSGFDWDGTKYMITVENENAWNEYVKSHEEAKRFRFKVIPNWDDIVDICAKDKATGIGGEHPFDSDDVMSKEANAEEENCSVNIGLEEPSSATKRKGHITCANKSRDKDGIINSMREVAESLKEFVQVSKRKMGGNAQEVVHEVLNELKMIPDLGNAQRYKAIDWLTENPNKLAILKALPLDEKMDFISAFMS